MNMSKQATMLAFKRLSFKGKINMYLILSRKTILEQISFISYSREVKNMNKQQSGDLNNYNIAEQQCLGERFDKRTGIRHVVKSLNNWLSWKPSNGLKVQKLQNLRKIFFSYKHFTL